MEDLKLEVEPPHPVEIEIEIAELFLDSDNPRHKPVEDESEAIRMLCENEKVFELAADIAQFGLSPLERFAVIPAQGSKDSGPYIVMEGNRRLCALKLLADPDSAPSGLVDRFRTIGASRAIEKVPAILFADKDSARLWLERLHSGEFDGRGRKPWTSEQKARFMGGGRHGRAQRILDFAQTKGWITEEERIGKLSVVDRWISNPVFREFLGLDFAKGSDDPHRTRPEGDFEHVLKMFIDLVKAGDTDDGVSTRAKAEDMKRKARELEEKIKPDIDAKKLDGRRIDKEPVVTLEVDPTPLVPLTSGPKKPTFPRLPHSPRIEAALVDLKAQKLQKLYYSLTKVPTEHAPLLAVGAWAFMEGLTAAAGRAGNGEKPPAFDAFLSEQRLGTLGISDREARKGVLSAIKHVASYGNMTKHDPKAGLMNGEQLYNDLECLEGLIFALIGEAKKRTA